MAAAWSPSSRALEVRGLEKVYPPSIRALRGVDLAVEAGEVLALVGPNGAGKSTITKILAGMESPTNGEIEIRGKPVLHFSPTVAREMGVAAIFQELPQAANLSAADNLGLGQTHGPLQMAKLWPRQELTRRYRDLAREIPDPPPPGALLANLSIAARQKVALIRALATDPAVLIIDEGLSNVSVAERRRLQATIRMIARNRHMAVIYITHFLDDALSGSDEVVVVRDGRVVLKEGSSSVSVTRLAAEIAGAIHDTSETEAGYVPDATKAVGVHQPASSVVLREKPEPVLQFRSLRANGLGPLDLTVYTGEWLGLYGPPGSGCEALLAVIAGYLPVQRGTIWRKGVPIKSRFSPQRRHSTVYCTGDRRAALVPTWSVEDNLGLARLVGRRWYELVTRRSVREAAQSIISDFGIVGQPDVEIQNLSGGNQQKVIIAQALSRHSEVFLANDITRGVDVAARANIHNMLRAAYEGRNGAMIMYSSEPEEVLEMCSRVLVFQGGQIMLDGRSEELDVARLIAGALSRSDAGLQ
jgi:ABC-type sugar transport system ATPase subunit